MRLSVTVVENFLTLLWRHNARVLLTTPPRALNLGLGRPRSLSLGIAEIRILLMMKKT